MTCSNWNLSLSSTFQDSTMLNLWVSLYRIRFKAWKLEALMLTYRTVTNMAEPLQMLRWCWQELCYWTQKWMFFIWDDSNPLWTNQVWNFRGEVSVFGCFWFYICMRVLIWLVKPNTKTCWFMRCSRLCIHHWNLGVGFVSMLKTRNHRRTCQKRNPNSGKPHTHTQHVNFADLPYK